MTTFPDDDLLDELLYHLPPDEVMDAVASLPPSVAQALLEDPRFAVQPQAAFRDPRHLLQTLLDGYRDRVHIQYISDRLMQAIKDVENGIPRKIALSMPPRSAKTTVVSQAFPAWVLSKHPDWPIMLTSYDGRLATSWSRQIRRWIDAGQIPGLEIMGDTRAVGEWETTKGGQILARSIRQPITGSGAKVLVIDDPHKDFIDSHSELRRDEVWNWWLTVAQLRLEPPALVVVVQTRWHEDDLIGRLLSPETEGDPDDWEIITIPSIANHDPALGQQDLLGREPGEPVLSPLVEETPEEALARWLKVKVDVGSYVFEAMYQQQPSSPTGSIFDMSWWKFWTTDPDLVSTDEDGEPDGHTILVDPAKDLATADWIDSWDMTFKGSESSDYVVGQRWASHGKRRFLIAQQRGRWSFTETLQKMNDWRGPDATPETSPYLGMVNRTLVESAANGEAIMDTLKTSVSNIKPVLARISKEARARSVSPDVERGRVYLPHPAEPGNEWVQDLMSELRQFPDAKHDDQVDALTQALREFKAVGPGQITVPKDQITGRRGTHPVHRSPALARSYKGTRRVPGNGRMR